MVKSTFITKQLKRIYFSALVFSYSFFLSACSDTQTPEMNKHINGTSHYSIRNTFNIQSSSAFPDSLAPIYPNPFNRQTGDSVINVFFTLKDTAEVKILIQNPIGDSIAVYRDSLLPPGSRAGAWQPLNAAGDRLKAGLYFITIRIAPNDPSRNYINSRLLQIESND